MGTNVTSSSGSVLEEPEIQKLQMQAKIFKENSLNKLNALKSTTQLLDIQSIWYQQAFARLFGDSFRTFKFQLSQHMNNLETLLNAETLHEMDSKSALSVIKVQFERFINSDLLKPLDIYSRSFSSDREVIETFRDYTKMTAQTFKETIIQNMNSIEQCIIERASHEQELKMTLKKLSERQLQIQQCKVQEVQSSVTSSGDETSSGIVSDEEIDKQKLEAHYSYMAKIQEVSPEESSSTSQPLEQVQNHDENDVFANVRRHSEQPESINDTYVLEKDDSNVIPDSSNICTNDNQVDQNAAECVDERAALANLIANLTLDTEENKTVLKQLKKANASLTQELEKCKTNLDETSRALGEATSSRDSSLRTKSQQKLCNTENTKVISDWKLRKKKILEQMIDNGQTINVLYEKCLIPRNQVIQPFIWKDLTFAIPRFAPNREETMTLDNESRSKLDKDTVKPYDYTRQNSLYEIFKAPSLEYLYQLERAKEVRKTMWRKRHIDKPSVVRQPNAQRIPKPSVLGKPTPFSNSPEMTSFQTKQSVNKTNVSDGLYKQVTQQNLHQIRKQAVRNTNVIAPGPSRNNPKHVSFQSPKEFVGSNDMLNPRASAQNKDAKSHNTTKRYVPVEKTSESKKPERLIPKGHRFSHKKTTTVPEKTRTPRSCLRWQPTGRILKTVCLRWVPTGKLLNSCTGKVENKPTHGSNVDIPTYSWHAKQCWFKCRPRSSMFKRRLIAADQAFGSFMAIDFLIKTIKSATSQHEFGITNSTTYSIAEDNQNHKLIADIENDIMDPVMQCTTLPSHLGFSQQKLVSFVTEIHTLSIDISLRDR
ncbi:hypothetical protein Tco_0755462 [Tanacetum coccineum]